MRANSSSSSSSLPDLPMNLHCLFTRPSCFIFTVYVATLALLLLPLCTFILWRKCTSSSSSSSSSSGAAASHCDAFTLHVVAMEPVGVLGCALACCGVFTELVGMTTAGGLMFSFTWYGEHFFHLLTCVERHLAAVHPVTYLRLRGERGRRVRNVSIGGVWLLSLAGAVLAQRRELAFLILCVLCVSVVVVSVCSLSVLRVLIRPGPGERGGGGARDGLDQSKRRALCTMVAILGALVLRLAGNLVWAAQYLRRGHESCVALACVFWMQLPSAMVLPVLFLHRAGEL